MEEILFFVLLGLSVVIVFLEGHDLGIRTPIDLPLCLLLGWIPCTIPFSLNPEYSFVEWRKLVAQCLVFYWAVYVIRQISQRQLVKGSGVPIKLLEGISIRKPTEMILIAVVLGALLLSGFALIDFLGRGGTWQDRIIRARAPGSDYNWLSTYMVVSIPIAFYYGTTSRVLRGKILSYGTLALAVLAQMTSYTRAGWLASVTQLVSLGMVTRRRILFVSVILVLALGSVAFLGFAKMGLQTDTLDAWTLEARVQVWRLGMDQILSHPLVGIGYGNNIFQPVLADSRMGDRPMHLHNTLLMFGVGSGIPALVLFSWVFVRLGLEFFPKADWKNWTESEYLRLCLGIVLVGFFCRNMFDYMFAGSLAYLFWILMACGLESCSSTMPTMKTQHALGVSGRRFNN